MSKPRFEDTSDGDHKDRVDVDLEKGRVTHERISKEGHPHEHEWSDTRQDSVSYGWRGTNYTEEEKSEEEESEEDESEEDESEDD